MSRKVFASQFQDISQEKFQRRRKFMKRLESRVRVKRSTYDVPRRKYLA